MDLGSMSGRKDISTNPTPAVADAMLEELLKARQRRTYMYHVVAISCLVLP